MAGDPRQVWMGNIPHYLDEASAIAELTAYGRRPYKLVLRSRGALQDAIMLSSGCTDQHRDVHAHISPHSTSRMLDNIDFGAYTYIWNVLFVCGFKFKMH